MSNKYDFASVEPKWQKYWEEHGSFRAKEDHTKPKFYALVEFPVSLRSRYARRTHQGVFPVWKLSPQAPDAGL